jgi:heme oxygenase
MVREKDERPASVRPVTEPGPATLDILRQATAGRHATIESQLGLRGAFARPHYGRVLQGFDAFLSVWEPRLLRALPARLQPWFTAGRRAVLVRRDLGALGLPALPWQASVPVLAGLPEALGSLYVLEGSALGGQFIAAQVRRHLDLRADHGAAYFHGGGAGTAARWRAFQRLGRSTGGRAGRPGPRRAGRRGDLRWTDRHLRLPAA